MILIVAGMGVLTWTHEARRRASGLVAPPASLTVLKIAGTAVAGVAVVLICNTNRGRLIPIKGVPWVVLIVLAVLAAWTFLLGRTKFGRYVYAIGGNAEAARRAGINLARIRTMCFVLASFTAGIAGIVYASRLRSVSTALDGGTLVLYAVAAAVIGGTSLFGGRGKAVHGVLGGIVIAAIDNGMGLQGYSAAAKYVVTALVLLVAVTIDAVARRNATRLDAERAHACSTCARSFARRSEGQLVGRPLRRCGCRPCCRCTPGVHGNHRRSPRTPRRCRWGSRSSGMARHRYP